MWPILFYFLSALNSILILVLKDKIKFTYSLFSWFGLILCTTIVILIASIVVEKNKNKIGEYRHIEVVKKFEETASKLALQSNQLEKNVNEIENVVKVLQTTLSEVLNTQAEVKYNAKNTENNFSEQSKREKYIMHYVIKANEKIDSMRSNPNSKLSTMEKEGFYEIKSNLNKIGKALKKSSRLNGDKSVPLTPVPQD